MRHFFLVIRSTLFYSIYSILTLIFGFCLLFLLPVLTTKARIRFLTQWALITIYSLRIICGVRFKLVGKDHIPKDKPFVALSNHQSQWETFFLGYALRPISIILKKELLSIPVFGWCISKMKPIAIDRNNPRQALKDIQTKGFSRIHDDQLPVLIFPEGTRQPPGTLGRFTRSGAQLAINANVPVIFISHNSGNCWIPGQFIKQPGLITVTISEARQISGREAADITEEAKQWITKELNGLDR